MIFHSLEFNEGVHLKKAISIFKIILLLFVTIWFQYPFIMNFLLTFALFNCEKLRGWRNWRQEDERNYDNVKNIREIIQSLLGTLFYNKT